MAPGVVCRWQADDVTVGDVIARADRMRCGEERTATRAAVVNLVVVAPDPTAAERARRAVAELGAHHPGRIVVVVPRPDDDPRIDADIELQETDLSERHLWWEVIGLTVRGPAARHLPSVVEPLLLHDLPVAAWHTGRVPAPDDLVTAGAHVLLDAGPDGGGTLESRLGDVIHLLRLRHVTDLEWLAVEPWRRALAAFFDPPPRRALLAAAEGAEVAGPGWRALLLGGWLADRLRLPPSQIRVSPGGATTSLRLDVGGRPLTVAADSGGQVVAGFDNETPTLGGVVPAGTAGVLGAALSRAATDPTYAAALSGAGGLAA